MKHRQGVGIGLVSDTNTDTPSIRSVDATKYVSADISRVLALAHVIRFN